MSDIIYELWLYTDDYLPIELFSSWSIMKSTVPANLSSNALAFRRNRKVSLQKKSEAGYSNKLKTSQRHLITERIPGTPKNSFIHQEIPPSQDANEILCLMN